jgi:hypothetical protein
MSQVIKHYPFCSSSDHCSHRFATELSGRKARRKNWEGLADEMKRAGWFDN